MQTGTLLDEAKKPSLREFGRYLNTVALCNGVGLASQAISGGANSDWYRELRKPPFKPPGVAFGVVWPILYTLMGVSLRKLLDRRRNGAGSSRATQLFAFQLMLNGLWTLVFFRWKSPGWAFVEIVVLLAAIGLTIRAAWRVSPVAGMLMIPYLVWVGFAMLLNGSIWWLNRR